jgi:hypothetical protein
MYLARSHPRGPSVNLIRSQQDYDNPNSLASKFRANRAKHVIQLIGASFAEHGQCRIIDLGGRPEYWRMIDRAFLERCKVHITTVNMEDQAPCDDPMFTQLTGDACALAYPDNSFEVCHSNSVVEHVGDWRQMERFAAESRRLAQRYYVQTPYFWFPVEPHFSSLFFHWLPESWRAKRMIARRHGFMPQCANYSEAMYSVQDARLLDKGMMKALFPDAVHVDETILGLTKSLLAIRG